MNRSAIARIPAVHGAPLLSCQGLTKVYRMGEVDVWALRGVDLTLAPGELVVLLGVS
ncbi:MAG TPA: ABC transporter ATP-binding protein, partial [Polyangia bacterium]|nr:ABC transporter ATP-binding protein [Polyangia bacterium]